MAKRPRRVYWDSCIFLAYLKEEESHGPTVLAVVDNMLMEAMSGDLLVLTSTMWRFEVLDENSLERFAQLELGFAAGAFLSAALTDRTAKLAGQIHRAYPKGQNRIAVPDAIHLATAIDNGCMVFYTLDNELLKRNGDVAGHQIKVERPDAGAQGLLFPLT